MRWIAVFAVLLSVRAGAQPDSVRAWGRRYTDWFFANHLTELYSHFAPAIHTAADSAKLATLKARVDTLLGQKQYIVAERVDGPRYEQTVTVEKIASLIIVRFGVDSAGRIASFIVLPSEQQEAVSAFLDYRTKTDLRLPFTGTWTVLWGGRTLAQNPHASSPDERFASDFVMTQGAVAGVLAPGAGTVVDVVDTGGDSTDAELGNYVVIDHGNGEFSFLANLHSGSITVRRGQHVTQAEFVGRVANNRLHYHMQSTPSFKVGAGMPAQFEHYVADGHDIDRGEPVRGQVVQSGHPSP